MPVERRLLRWWTERLVWLLELTIVIGVVWAIRSSLAGFLYYMEDYTTGFLKVRDLANAANAESLWILSNHTPDELYGEYSLAIGNTKSSGFMNTLMLPGDFRSSCVDSFGHTEPPLPHSSEVLRGLWPCLEVCSLCSPLVEGGRLWPHTDGVEARA
jgi:hypothetical protein